MDSDPNIVDSCLGPRQLSTILITNDDGPPGQHSPFISTFVRTLLEQLTEATIIVYLPSRQQSWVSKMIDRFGTVRLRTLTGAPDAYPEKGAKLLERASWTLVEGSPATAVLVALRKLYPVKPDLIIAGPNLGQNCGSSYILSSGTVAGALEGALQNIRSISLSVAYEELPHNWEPYIPSISALCLKLGDVVAKLWKTWPSQVHNLLFNVNISLESRPDARIRVCTALNETYGLLYSKLDSAGCDDRSESFVFSRCHFSKDPPEGTDRKAINDGFISVTPLLPRLCEPVLPKHCFDAISSL